MEANDNNKKIIWNFSEIHFQIEYTIKPFNQP